MDSELRRTPGPKSKAKGDIMKTRGAGVIVEIGGKYNRGRKLSQMWVFWGKERVSKKIFIVPFLDSDRRAKSTPGFNHIIEGVNHIIEGFNHIIEGFNTQLKTSVTEARVPGWKMLPKEAEKASESLGVFQPWWKDSSRRFQNGRIIPRFTRVNNCEIPPDMGGMHEIFNHYKRLFQHARILQSHVSGACFEPRNTKMWQDIYEVTSEIENLIFRLQETLPEVLMEFKPIPTRSCPNVETKLLKLDVSYDNVPQGRSVDGRALILDLETQTTTRRGCSQIHKFKNFLPAARAVTEPSDVNCVTVCSETTTTYPMSTTEVTSKMTGSTSEATENTSHESESTTSASETTSQGSESTSQGTKETGGTSEETGSTSEETGSTSEVTGKTSEETGSTSEETETTSARPKSTTSGSVSTSQGSETTTSGSKGTSEGPQSTTSASASTTQGSESTSDSGSTTQGSESTTSVSEITTQGTNSTTSGSERI
nr:mucin-22-like [Penaeus vannamei]